MTEKPIAVFRCDAKPEIGGGHVYRCLTLANALHEHGWTCLFISNAQALELVPALNSCAHDVEVIDNADLSQPFSPKAYQGTKVALAVIDHYGIDQAVEKQCRVWAKKVMVIDDLANRPHECDVLLDQTFGRKPESYADLVPSECLLLLGAEYCLLRPEFADYRASSLERRDALTAMKTVSVSFGATDPFNLSGTVVEALTEIETPLDVHIITPHDPPEAVAKAPQHTFRFSKHVGEMWTEMHDADLAIGASGTTSWERCTLGVPSVMITTADNQVLIAQNLHDRGAALYLGAHETVLGAELSKCLAALCSDPHELQRYSKNARTICDGQGANKVVEALAH